MFYLHQTHFLWKEKRHGLGTRLAFSTKELLCLIYKTFIGYFDSHSHSSQLVCPSISDVVAWNEGDHTQENKDINAGPHIYWFTPYWHSKEVRILMNVPTFWIIPQEVFIVHHSFKYSHSPKKIRNRTIARRVGNGLNFLSYDKMKESQYGLRQDTQCNCWCSALHMPVPSVSLTEAEPKIPSAGYMYKLVCHRWAYMYVVRVTPYKRPCFPVTVCSGTSERSRKVVLL